MDPVEPYTKPVQEFLSGTTSSSLSDIASGFTQIVPDHVQFQVALNVLLPMTRTTSSAEELRIQAIYLLWYLYRNHSLDMNPFKGAFQDLLREETEPLSKPAEVAPLILTVQAVLGGKGFDLAPYSPQALITKWPLSTTSRPLVSSIRPGTGGPGQDNIQVVDQLLRQASEDVLNLSEQRVLLKLLPTLTASLATKPQEDAFPITHLPKIVTNNPGTISYHVMSRILVLADGQGRDVCWGVLTGLPVTLSSFDLWTRLLADSTVLDTSYSAQSTDEITSAPGDSGMETVASITRKKALALFLAHCESTIESMLLEERSMENRNVDIDPEGSCGLALQHFARFGLALVRSKGDIRRGVWSIGMDKEEWFGITTVLQDFALRFVRFEGPCELYRALTRGSQKEPDLGG